LEPGRRFEDIARETAFSNSVLGALGREEDWLRERIACFNDPQGSMEMNFTDGRCIQIINRKTSEGGTVGIRIDNTEQKSREQKLHQAQKMEAVGQLTGGVAHDFNNLLTVVLGNLELLSDRLKADDASMKFVERALSSAHRGATLTARLLAFSRQQALVPKPIAALDLIRGMTDLLRRTLEESVEMEFVGIEDLWRCKADPGQLESAILNLAINARDAMSGSGKLTIETANVELNDDYAAAQAEVAAGQYVMIAVTDTGTGMKQDVIDKVFDPFFTTKDVGKGSGLGLSMVYGFVKQSGGYVTIYSEEGIGTTVKLYLPRFKGVGEEIQRPETVATPEANGETILVVEDDPDVRTMTVALLKDIGYEILEASDADSALKMLATSSRINMLFTDVVLPGGMNGPKLAAEIRRQRPGIAVLYTSGYTENAIVHQGQVDEGIELLNKPFSRSDLARKIRAVLDKSMS
jgi:signal transduction histidine kinase